jgi:hypothetical protein
VTSVELSFWHPGKVGILFPISHTRTLKLTGDEKPTYNIHALIKNIFIDSFHMNAFTRI